MRKLILALPAVFLMLACGRDPSTPVPTPVAQQQQPYYDPSYSDPNYNGQTSTSNYNEYTSQTTTGVSDTVLYGQDGTFLGYISGAITEAEHVCNSYGTYGSPSSGYSIRNPYGSYGSTASQLSANNPAAQYPPVIYLWDGAQLTFLDYLTTNPALTPRIDPSAIFSTLCRVY